MSEFLIREAAEEDLRGLLALYTHLHGNKMPEEIQGLRNLWDYIMHDPNHHILLGCADGEIVSSCVLLIVPNLTHGQRPYAFIENVVTHPDFRGRGYASRVLERAGEIARARRCYKIMLMTGSREEKTLRFYRGAGYNSEDKTAFIRWLP